MKYWLIVLVLLVFCPYFLFLFFYVSVKCHRLKRYHIGQWKSDSEWEKKVEAVSYKWLRKTPVVNVSENSDSGCLQFFHITKRSETVQSWQTGGLILGINSTNSKDGAHAIQKWKTEHLTSDGNWINPVTKVDAALLAYSVLEAEENPKTIKPAMDWTVNLLETNLCDDGMVSYSQGKTSNIRYVDTLGMVCPFLALYGVRYQSPRHIEMAYNQLKLFHENGLTYGLPVHAYLAKEKIPLGTPGWGRGTVWYTMALADTYDIMPEGNMKTDLKMWICEAAECCSVYQKKDGSFYTILHGSGQYDSSATAGLAYFFMKCFEIFGNQKYKDKADNCLKRIKTVTMRSGAVDQCQGDTLCIGTFSHRFDIMPFIQGIVLRTISIRKKQ